MDHTYVTGAEIQTAAGLRSYNVQFFWELFQRREGFVVRLHFTCSCYLLTEFSLVTIRGSSPIKGSLKKHNLQHIM